MIYVSHVYHQVLVERTALSARGRATTECRAPLTFRLRQATTVATGKSGRHGAKAVLPGLIVTHEDVLVFPFIPFQHTSFGK